MLCQFSFSNFKSYKDETTFDLQATAAAEYKDSIITMEKTSSLLPVAVVYGPNGGGKSTLLQALSCVISIVVLPITSLGKNRLDMVFQHTMESEPFLFDEVSKDNPTEFRVYFRINGYEYRYYIAVLNGSVVSESLARVRIGGKKPSRIFDRDGDEIELGPSVKENVSRSVNPKMPYLSFLAINHNLPEISDVQIWFESCITLNYSNPSVERSYYLFREDKRRLLSLLNDMDIDISDYRIDEDDHLFLSRKMDGKSYELPFHCESEGTKKLISVLPMIMFALEEGRLAVIDELDAKLHPKLLQYIVQLFHNPQLNKKGAQLVFTSHDLATMKNTVFRRDEIWFACEDANHISHIYSLYDIRRENNIRVNNTASYDKQYLEGRYGADPYLQNMIGEIWNESETTQEN